MVVSHTLSHYLNIVSVIDRGRQARENRSDLPSRPYKADIPEYILIVGTDGTPHTRQLLG
jgi:hypothetical protein